MLTTFSQNLTGQEAFEIRGIDKRQVNNKTEFDDTFCKKIKLLVNRFSPYFSLNVENR